jgi:hypothetical protein
VNGGLVLVARAGFIPNGNDDRSHRDATLLDLRVAGAGGEGVMAKGGHVALQRLGTVHIAAGVPSRSFMCW